MEIQRGTKRWFVVLFKNLFGARYGLGANGKCGRTRRVDRWNDYRDNSFLRREGDRIDDSSDDRPFRLRTVVNRVKKIIRRKTRNVARCVEFVGTVSFDKSRDTFPVGARRLQLTETNTVVAKRREHVTVSRSKIGARRNRRRATRFNAERVKRTDGRSDRSRVLHISL